MLSGKKICGGPLTLNTQLNLTSTNLGVEGVTKRRRRERMRRRQVGYIEMKRDGKRIRKRLYIKRRGQKLGKKKNSLIVRTTDSMRLGYDYYYNNNLYLYFFVIVFNF